MCFFLSIWAFWGRRGYDTGGEHCIAWNPEVVKTLRSSNVFIMSQAKRFSGLEFYDQGAGVASVAWESMKPLPHLNITVESHPLCKKAGGK